MHAREQPVSFWRENMMAVIIQQRDLAFAIGRGSINNRINLVGEKSKMKLSGVSFLLRTSAKTLS